MPATKSVWFLALQAKTHPQETTGERTTRVGCPNQCNKLLSKCKIFFPKFTAENFPPKQKLCGTCNHLLHQAPVPNGIPQPFAQKGDVLLALSMPPLGTVCLGPQGHDQYIFLTHEFYWVFFPLILLALPPGRWEGGVSEQLCGAQLLAVVKP